MLFHLKKLFYIIILIKTLLTFQVLCQVRLKEEALKQILYQGNFTNNKDEIEDISVGMNNENDIITFEPDIFNKAITLPQNISKGQVIVESNVYSFKQNTILLKCMPINVFTCKTVRNRNNDGYIFKVIVNKDIVKIHENITYLDIEIFLHDFNGITKEYNKRKNRINFMHHTSNNTLINKQKNEAAFSVKNEVASGSITFDQSTYFVMLFSGPTKRSVISRGKISLRDDGKTFPTIWIDNQSNGDIFEIDNIKRQKDNLYSFDIILKNNTIIKENNGINETISATLKAKQSNSTGKAEIIAEVITEHKFGKNTTKFEYFDDITLPNSEKIHETLEYLKESGTEEHLEESLIPFTNIDVSDQEVSRTSIRNKYNYNFKDNNKVVLNKVLKFDSINEDNSNEKGNILSKLQDSTLIGKQIVLNNNLNSHVNDKRNNYNQNIVSGQKLYKLENKSTKTNISVLENVNNNLPFVLPEKEGTKKNVSKNPFIFNVLENSLNGTIIEKLTMLNNVSDGDIDIVMFNETKDYLFKVRDNYLILICQNKQQHCIDYEEDKEIQLLLLTNQNNPLLLTILIINEDEKDPKVVLYNKDIKISNDKMLNQFLFSVTDEDGIESNEILLKGDVSRHFTIQKVQDDGLYQIVYLSTPPSGKNEISIIVKGKDPSKRSITKNIAVKVIANNHKARFRKDNYNIVISGKKIVKDENLIHLELEGVSIDSVDFYILEGNPGWVTVEKYGGDVKISSNISNIYNGKYDILIGAVDKEISKVVAMTTLTIQIVDWLESKPVFMNKLYSVTVGSHQKNDTIDIDLLPNNSNRKIYIEKDTILGWNEEVKPINFSKSHVYIKGNKAKVSLKDIPFVKSLYFQVHLHDFPTEKALVAININTDESERLKQIEKYSKLIFSRTHTSDIISLSVEIPENSSIGKVIENIYSYNPLTGKGPSECFIENEFEKYFHIDVSNGDILLIKQIDYDTLDNPEFDVVISCYQNQSEPIKAIMNVKVINVADNSPVINIPDVKYPFVFEIDKSTSENYNIFNFSITDVDGEPEHSLEILGDDSFKFVIEKNFGQTYFFKTASNAIFDYPDSRTLKLILVAKDREENVGKALITIKFTNKSNQLPYMEKKYFEFKIVKNWPENIYVGTLFMKKNSDYLGNGSIEFSIEDQPDDYFKIEKNTGRISTARSLKNISIDVPYEMRIVVSSKLNKNFKDSAIVTINIIDPDTLITYDKKHLKILQPKDGEIIKISEIFDVRKEIYSVKLEYNGNTLDLSNTNIEYKIINLSNKNDTTFSITNDGKIFITSELNYEKVSKYTLLIEVKNKDIKDDIKSVLVFIEIENENNKMPYFIEDYTNRLFTFNKSSIVLAQVKAVDKDLEPHNKIYYHIIKQCGKNYNKLQIDMLTGEIRRAKYKSTGLKQSKPLQKYFEVCIYASQYNFTLKNSRMIFNKNRKDQVKIKIRYDTFDKVEKIENMVTNNYLHNNTVEHITKNLHKLPIYYGENKLNHLLHKNQIFKMQSFTLTPASYEPNAKILHINKNKRIFRINELSGDIVVDPKIMSYPEGIYKITFTLSDGIDFNKTSVYKKNYHFIDEKNKMKFVFDTPASKMGFRLKDFQNALEKILKESSKVNKYNTEIYLENKIISEENYKSSVCFHVADEDIVKSTNEYKNFFETLFSKYPQLGIVYEEFSVRNIIKCSENWEQNLKKGFIDKVTLESNDKSWKEYLFIIIFLTVVLVVITLFLYYCIALRYRFHLLIKKEHLRLVTNKRIMAISRANEKQLVKSSPQFAIGMSTDLLEY